MEINYIGEELIWGNIGNSLLIAAFTAALLAVAAYLAGTYCKDENEAGAWKKACADLFLYTCIQCCCSHYTYFYLNT